MADQSQKIGQPQIQEGKGQARRDKFWTVIVVIVAVTALLFVIKERKFGGETGISSEKVGESYVRTELNLSQSWTTKVPVSPNQSIYIWRHGTSGVEVMTDNGIVDYDAGDRLGKLRWAQFRVKEGSGVLSYCKVPKGKPDSLCK